jgi:uncharacterized protein (DUF924 family)
MTDDESEVAHMTDISPADILTFWRAAGPKRWFNKDAAFDAEVRARFFAVWEAARDGRLKAWEDSDDGALALILVLDQFPRNLFRDDARAFSTDPEALALARRAVARGVDARVDPALRAFVYLPFMHSENLADQERCVALCRAVGLTDNIDFAVEHADIIRRFGRFPHRNRVLGRATTPEEAAFLAGGGFGG